MLLMGCLAAAAVSAIYFIPNISAGSILFNLYCPEGAFCVGGLKFFMFVRPYICKSDVRCSQSDRDDRDRIAISGDISEIEHFWSKIALVNEPKFQICIGKISVDNRYICRYQTDIGHIGINNRSKWRYSLS